MARRAMPCILLASAWLCADLAHAEPHGGGASSEKLVRRGVELKQRGRDKRAAELFQRAYELDGSSEALARLGETEYALGRLPEARDHLAAALARADAWVARHRRQLEHALEGAGQKVGDDQSGDVVVVQHASEPEPRGSAVSEASLRALLDAEHGAEQSLQLLVQVEGALAELEGRLRARPAPSLEAAVQARAAIASMEQLIARCEASLAQLEVPLSGELARAEE